MENTDKTMVTYDDVINLGIKDVFNIYKEYSNQKLPDIYKRFSFGRALINKAEGSFLTDSNGKKVFDMTGGLGVANFGHNHPRILNIRKKFTESLRPEIHKSYLNPFLAGASKNISAVLKCDLKYSFFCNSGAEAVDGALKITYKRYNGRKKFVLHSDRSFHGKSLGAGSLSAGDNFVGGKGRFYFQKIPNVLAYEFNSFKSIVRQCESAGVDNVYAIFVEPYSCSTLTESNESFLKDVREYCDTNQISLVYDEIYSGFAKCGYDFYFHKYKITPDVICLSKALGAGKSSISAYVSNKKVYSEAYGTVAGALTHSTTYNSFGEECVTAMEACNMLVDESLSENSKLIERYLHSFLQKLKDDFPNKIKEIRGSGTHFGIIFKKQMNILEPLIKIIPIDFTSDPLFLSKLYATAVANAMWEDGDMLAAFTSNQEVILNISPAPISDISILEKYLKNIYKTLDKDPYLLIMKIIKNGVIKL